MGACDTLVGDALTNARRVQENASDLGFDWTEVADVLGKLREEVGELEQALADEDLTHVRSELGDVLFSAVNLSRFVEASPTEELDAASKRFSARFEALRAILADEGRAIGQCTPEELDRVWEQVKREENDGDGSTGP